MKLKVNLFTGLLLAVLCCACSQKSVNSDTSSSPSTAVRSNSLQRDTSPVKTEERKLEGFSKLSSQVPGKLEVTIGSPTSVKVTCNQDSLPKITTEVKDSTLIIRSDAVNVERLEVSVVVSKLDAVALSGAGSGTFKNLEKSGLAAVNVNGACRVDMDFLKAKNVDVTVSGASKVKAGGNCENLNLTVTGASGAVLSDLKAENCAVKISGASMASSQVVGKVTGSVTGASSLTLSGKPRVNEVVADMMSGVRIQ